MCITGTPGRNGITGASGVAGLKGDVGATGASGLTGLIGATGFITFNSSLFTLLASVFCTTEVISCIAAVIIILKFEQEKHKWLISLH